jgi:ornithine cyclodeaminase
MRIKVFSARDIDRALSMAEAVEVVKDAFIQLSLKKAQSPVRTSLTLKEPGEAALVMPAYLQESRALGAKMVTVLPCNPQSNLPAVQGIVFLFDAATGSPGHSGGLTSRFTGGRDRGHPGPLPAVQV